MFGKTKRTNSYLGRFQNSRFKEKLRQARGYKRPSRPRPETAWDVFLAKIGLGSTWSKTLTLAVFVFLIYLIFIPNWFFVKTISITGATGDDLLLARATVNAFLDTKLPWPQKNLLVLSKARLKNYLLHNDQKILSVESISKKFPSTLALAVSPRVNSFLLQTDNGNNYSLSSDGLITGLVYPSPSGTLPSGLISVKLKAGGESLSVGQTILTPEKMSFLTHLPTELAQVLNLPIDYYQLTDAGSSDLVVYFKNGPKILFNLSLDFSQTVNRLKLLLAQLGDTDKKRIYYVDMRFLDKAYICYKNTACVKDINLPKTEASSTNQTIY